MRLALGQTNPTIGDLAGNERRLAEMIDQALGEGADLIVFPELAIIGYPPKDLLLKPAVVQGCLEAVERLADRCRGIAAVIGLPVVSDAERGLALHNAAAWCEDGRIVRTHRKSLLPTYDVFDETRYFEPGPAVELASAAVGRIGVSICEDLWNDPEIFHRPLYGGDPIQTLAAAGAEVVVNCSASPYVAGKHAFRHRLIANAATKHRLPIVYCNQVGGNDELIFDGGSCVVAPGGEVLARARDFEEDLLLVDMPTPDAGDASPAGRVEPQRTGLQSVCAALVLGIRDYCRKCGFDSVVLGLSGGIDSAVTAALAVAAMGPDRVRGVAMPSRFSSQGSIDDARELAGRLEIRFDVAPIDGPHHAFEDLLSPLFAGREPDVAEENVQARIRGVILMALSNKFGSLLLSTGNKSEMAVGYSTLYGDMAGGLAVLIDVPKTMVWGLARWINNDPDSPLRRRFGRAVIPESSITKPPSAELRPDQTDQDSLPPYEQLDRVIELYVEQERSMDEILAETELDEGIITRVIRMIDRNEYKRKQAPPGLKVTGRAFGFGRRMPIAQRYDATRSSRTMEPDTP